MNENIETIKRKMLVKYPFFGSVVANVDYKETREMDTAGTDGQTIYYNPDFLKKLKSDEQIFIFAHEVCHIAFDHIRRSEGKDPDIWNTATDAVINQFLKRDGLKIVGNGVDIAEAINYDAEQLYDKLLQQKKQNQEQDNQQNQENSSSSEQKQQGQGQSSETQSQEQSDSQQHEQNSSSSKQNQSSSKASQNQNEKQSQGQSSETQSQEQFNSQQKEQNSSSKQNQNSSKDSQKQNEKQSQGQSSETQSQNENKSKGNSSSDSSEENHRDVGHDTHSLWKDAVKRQKEKEAKAKQESNKHQIEEQKQKEEDLKQEITYISTMGEKRAFNKNLEEKKKELEALKQVLIEQVMEAGTSTNREQRIINDIGKSKPIIDWRYVLREAIQFDVDWSYKNAYIEDGVVSANLEEQPRPEAEIVLDTSGSIDEILLKNFLRECKNILQHSKVKVGCFDTEFYGFHEIRTEEDIENMKFEGGGGTDFNAAVRAFTRRVENKIIFTDGWANMPDISMDVIWIVFGGREIHPKSGKVIQINEEQLDKLYSLNQDMLYQRKK